MINTYHANHVSSRSTLHIYVLQIREISLVLMGQRDLKAFCEMETDQLLRNTN